MARPCAATTTSADRQPGFTQRRDPGEHAVPGRSASPLQADFGQPILILRTCIPARFTVRPTTARGRGLANVDV